MIGSLHNQSPIGAGERSGARVRERIRQQALVYVERCDWFRLCYKRETERRTTRTHILKRVTNRKLLFETRDMAHGGAWVHRSYSQSKGHRQQERPAWSQTPVDPFHAAKGGSTFYRARAFPGLPSVSRNCSESVALNKTVPISSDEPRKSRVKWLGRVDQNANSATPHLDRSLATCVRDLADTRGARGEISACHAPEAN